jgi:hypothetical protein
MTKLHIAALAAIAALATACGPAQNSNTAATATSTEPAFTLWSSLGPQDVKIAPGVVYAAQASDGGQVGDISAVPANAASDGFTGGVAVHLPAATEDEASGHQIRITVRASSPTVGASLGVAYSTNDVGNSGWHQFTLTQTPAEYSFTYKVAAKVRGAGDYLGFRSYGDAHVQVAGYKIEVIGADAAAH